MSVSVIETELVEAAAFEPTKNYERQDYLAALARAINDVDETTFDGLSVEAQEWFNDAVKALNKKKELPEFPDAPESEAEEPVDDDGEDSEEDPTDDNPEAEDEAEEEAPAPKKAAKGKTNAKGNSKADPIKEFEPPVRKKVIPVRKQARHGGEMDRYGVNSKAKGHQAVLMLEKGCKMTEVQDEVGGTYYNLLRKLIAEGHKVEKNPNGIIRLTHKDDVGVVKKKVKK